MGDIAVLSRCGLVELRRRPFLLVLLVVIPLFFITRAISVTQPIPRLIGLPGGESVLTDMRALHGATMAVITIGLLAGLVGVFIMEASRSADQRLVAAGMRPRDVVISRLITLALATSVVVVVSLGVTAINFTPRSWVWFTVAAALTGALYAAGGAVCGAMFGRVGATYVLLLTAMLDLGVVQNPMFGSGDPSGWATLMPGYGAVRVTVDAAFGSQFTAWGGAAIALGWAVFATAAASLVLGRALRTR